MNEILALIFALILSLLAGVLLGTIFFGGLWWTIPRGVSSKQPAALFFFSLLLRTGIALAGFYFVARGDWRRVAGLPGWIFPGAHPGDLAYPRTDCKQAKRAQTVGEVCR